MLDRHVFNCAAPFITHSMHSMRSMTPSPQTPPFIIEHHYSSQLEKQLAAAERCAAELKEVSTSLTGARVEDMELLKVSPRLAVLASQRQRGD